MDHQCVNTNSRVALTQCDIPDERTVLSMQFGITLNFEIVSALHFFFVLLQIAVSNPMLRGHILNA